MRIAIFTEVFLPKIDGITNRLRHTIDCLIEDGHKVIVFGPLSAQNHYRGVKVVQIPGLPFPPYPGLQISYADPRIMSQLIRFRPDIVHAVGPASLGALGIAAARMLGFPVVASYHTDLPAYLPKHGVGFAQPVIWPAIRGIHNRAHHNLCPSTVTRDELESHGIEPVGIWRGGVNTDRFCPESATKEMRQRLTPCARKEPVRALALYVGRISPEKNLERFFDLHDAIPELHIAIVGDGPDRQRLQAKSSGRRIHFTGFLRGHDLAEAYASADLFFMPSTTETLGFVVLESMSSGTPAVAADAGGVRDLISHGENGLLFDPANLNEPIEQIRQLIENPAQRRHLAQQARKFAEAGSWQLETRKLIGDYKQTIQRARRTDLLTRLRLGS